jgi:hypothetical protein
MVLEQVVGHRAYLVLTLAFALVVLPRLEIVAPFWAISNIVVTYEIQVFFEGAKKEVFSSI